LRIGIIGIFRSLRFGQAHLDRQRKVLLRGFEYQGVEARQFRRGGHRGGSIRRDLRFK
jgi:hypothetical protein